MTTAMTMDNELRFRWANKLSHLKATFSRLNAFLRLNSLIGAIKCLCLNDAMSIGIDIQIQGEKNPKYTGYAQDQCGRSKITEKEE